MSNTAHNLGKGTSVKQVVVMNQDGSVTVTTLPESSKQELAFLQNAVGGYVQVIDLAGAFEGIAIWVNEDGKFDSTLSRNQNATFVWEQAFGAGTDVMVGNAVFTGIADENGETQGLTHEEQTFLFTSAMLANALR